MNILKDASYTSIYTLLNLSFFSKNYYSLYDIRNIISCNIDFTLSKNFYIKNIDKYIVDSVIPSMDKQNKLLLKMKPMAEKLIGEE